MSSDADAVAAWVAAYERCWRTDGTDALRELFATGVRYSPSPWASVVVGIDELASFWDAERDGPDEGFAMTAQVLAVDGARAVVRVGVDYVDGERWRDLWVLEFDTAGRCTSFEEWPFAPDQPDGH